MVKNFIKKIFGRDDAVDKQVTGSFIIVKLNDKVMPTDRGDLYEDPIDEFLRKNKYGEITGGGTMQLETTEISYCEIEIMVNYKNDVRFVAKEILRELESYGVPKGSRIIIGDTNEEISFGKSEGLAIYLDGVNLPVTVYEECDSNLVLSELSRLIGYEGEVQRYWQGERETAFYFYGRSFEEMKSAISDFIETYPLCQGARIIQIA